jgi:hypothetical protein
MAMGAPTRKRLPTRLRAAPFGRVEGPKHGSKGSKRSVEPQNLVNAETVAALQDELEYLWEVYRVDLHYRHAFSDSVAGTPPTYYIQRLATEINNLYNERAAVQQLQLGMQKREEALAAALRNGTLLAETPTLADKQEFRDNASPSSPTPRY